MLKRPLIRSLTALSLSLLIFCAVASPARAWSLNPGDPGLSFWSSFLTKISHWFTPEGWLDKDGSSGGVQGGPATGGNGGGPVPLSCPPSNPNCGANENDNGTGANPLGRP